MGWWIYKCNSKKPPPQVDIGDWAVFFESDDISQWGSSEWIRGLTSLTPGDRIIAYQTDRKELVGLAEVVQIRPHRSRNKVHHYLYLKPLEKIGVRVPPLKKADPRIAAIPALKPGPIQTLYSITASDARRLLKAAGSRCPVSGTEDTRRAAGGGGFQRDTEAKRNVEDAAIKCVSTHYRRLGWSVEDVSQENRGYDLLCSRKSDILHVEVKGTSGSDHSFPITAAEKRAWETDRRFVLALVTDAVNSPTPHLYEGQEAIKRFEFAPVSYMARRRE